MVLEGKEDKFLASAFPKKRGYKVFFELSIALITSRAILEQGKEDKNG